MLANLVALGAPEDYLLLTTQTDIWALRYPATNELWILERSLGGMEPVGGFDERSAPFHHFLRQSLAQSSVVIYDGHSGLGSHLDLAAMEPRNLPDQSETEAHAAGISAQPMERRKHPLALGFRNLIGRPLVAFVFRHPDASIIAQRLRHQRKLRLVVARHGYTGGMYLCKTWISEVSTFSMSFPDCCYITSHCICGQVKNISISTTAQ